MFKFRNPFNREKWALVTTLKSVRGNMYTYHIHLFESEKGKRKIECLCDGQPYDLKDPTNTWLVKTDLYQEKVYRWLKGRRDPDVPRYNELGEEDTANFLKGSI